MLESAALLALCVQVADLSSLYLSFEPTGAALEQTMDEAEIRWVERLRAEVGDDAAFVAVMHDGFVSAMQLDGAAFWDQWGACQASLDAGSPAPGQKG
jgi:microcystin degradation protein MlrC